MINVKRLESFEFQSWLFNFSASAVDRILRELQAYHPDPYSSFDNRIIWVLSGAIHRAFEPELGTSESMVRERLESCITLLADFLRLGFGDEAKQNAPTTRTIQ